MCSLIYVCACVVYTYHMYDVYVYILCSLFTFYFSDQYTGTFAFADESQIPTTIYDP